MPGQMFPESFRNEEDIRSFSTLFRAEQGAEFKKRVSTVLPAAG